MVWACLGAYVAVSFKSGNGCEFFQEMKRQLSGVKSSIFKYRSDNLNTFKQSSWKIHQYPGRSLEQM